MAKVNVKAHKRRTRRGRVTVKAHCRKRPNRTIRAGSKRDKEVPF